MQGLRGTRQGEYTTPRTTLGFYGLVLFLVELGMIPILAVLASTDALHYLVPYVLAFGGAVFIVLIGIVVALNVIDPTKLQLGQGTFREFMEYQATMGDSDQGETVTTISNVPVREVSPSPDRALDAGDEPDGPKGAPE